MVARTSVVVSAAPSPVAAVPVAPPRAPLSVPLPPLGGGASGAISKATVPAPSRLQKLFLLGQRRFDNDSADFDADAFADAYCRVLQTAVRSNHWRNKRMQKELRMLREQNAMLISKFMPGGEVATPPTEHIEERIYRREEEEKKIEAAIHPIISNGTSIKRHEPTAAKASANCAADAQVVDDATPAAMPSTA